MTLSKLPAPMSTNGSSSAPTCTAVGADSMRAMDASGSRDAESLGASPRGRIGPPHVEADATDQPSQPVEDPRRHNRQDRRDNREHDRGDHRPHHDGAGREVEM